MATIAFSNTLRSSTAGRRGVYLKVTDRSRRIRVLIDIRPSWRSQHAGPRDLDCSPRLFARFVTRSRRKDFDECPIVAATSRRFATHIVRDQRSLIVF